MNTAESSAQRSDTSYIPQITLKADNGFGPYLLGKSLQNTFSVTDLPEHTTMVIFQFIDADSILVGQDHAVNGTDLQEAVWTVNLDSLGLPLSPQFKLHVNFQTDSVADYYVAYSVYPDTISFFATAGWGPFITNNYMHADSSWQPVPEQANTFTVSKLPPRTHKVLFQVLEADSTIVDSLLVTSAQGEYLDSARLQDLKMDELPLSTRYLRVVLYCQGGSDQGLEYHKVLQIVPQLPKLETKSEGQTYSDSIPDFLQDPDAGQALIVDSIKHAEITNGPGTKYLNWFSGPYSLDIIKGIWSIEAWIRIDLNNIQLNNENEQDFIYVDSAFCISYLSKTGGEYSGFRLYSLVDDQYFLLYEADFSNSLLEGNEWHHFAFTLDGTYNNVWQFYLDGQAMDTYADQEKIAYIQQWYPDYDQELKTKALILGGWTGDQFSFVTGFDEVRVWHSLRTVDDIRDNMHKTILQDFSLRGYWTFDDLRNRLGIISDISRSNNSGVLKNGASFMVENSDIFNIEDTLLVYPSNAETDSVKFVFLTRDAKSLDSSMVSIVNGKAALFYDISSLPYTVDQLKVAEYYPGCNEDGFATFYNMHGFASEPIATPLCNWGTYYYSADNFGDIQNSIHVTSFPENTTKVELGLKSGDNYFDTMSYFLNSVPYQYNLSLNGTDNYIQTSTQMTSPESFEISMWFRTTSTEGGRLFAFCDNPQGVNCTQYGRQLFMEKDGSLRFRYRFEGEDVILFGSNKYNDGEWHCVTVFMAKNLVTRLLVDGSVVDRSDYSADENFPGYWVIGRTDETGMTDGTTIAQYFRGSLAYINISITNKKDRKRSGDKNLMNYATRGDFLYKLDEGKGNIIHDSQGNNNASLEGSGQLWFKTNKISSVRWQANMIDKQADFYTFYAKVYYAGGGEEGVYYPLGKFEIENPVPDYAFSYDFSNGLGYFNEGEKLYNTLEFNTEYTGNGQTDWKENFLKYQVLSPQHVIVSENTCIWTSTGYESSLVMDMGETPAGSYVNIQLGYNSTDNYQVINYQFSIPLLIRPMMAPVLTGNFGPFQQAIAPGTMEQENTFNIFTEGLSDLSKITAKFFDENGKELGSTEGVHIDDTTWHITYNMATLSPPETKMKLYYYLGSNYYLAKVAGPYNIQIHRTRPHWFDFIGDNAFSEIVEQGDSVTFELNSPFESSYLINNSESVKVPKWVPLIGETECEMEMPGAKAYLKFMKPESKLELNEPPEFFQKVFNLGAGSPSTLSLGFNYSQNNTYELDKDNNLIATQNFSMGGNITSGFEKLENIVKRLKELVKTVQVADPESVVVSPSFEISYTGSFQYASRLRLMIDSTTGQWGSYGNLNIDANINHPAAYANSTSFHFYSGAADMEFGIGATLFEGLLSAHFGINGRFVLGFGHSYVTIPNYKEKALKSFAFQTYGRFYVDVLWGWYEKTVWGPKMFYSTTIWGDDMSDCFPPAGKYQPRNVLNEKIQYKSALVRDFHPVNTYSRTPLPKPQSGIIEAGDNLVINWLERGHTYGERRFVNQFFNKAKNKFSSRQTVESNFNALNTPSSILLNEHSSLHTWSQSRYTQESFSSEDPLKEFLKSQDIWFAVYNQESDSVMKTEMVEDQIQGTNDGRAEANPHTVMLNADKALLTWQVVDLDIPKSDIWFTTLEFNGQEWAQGSPLKAFDGEGVESQVKLTSPNENMAVLVWMNTDRTEDAHTKVMSASFNGNSWSQPETVSAPGDDYCNYMDIKFKDGRGELIYTAFVEDTENGNYEKIIMVPWAEGYFRKELAAEILVDSSNHLQLPVLAISDDEKAVIAVKKELMAPKDQYHKICQVDLLKGDLNAIHEPWEIISANPYICDTNKQVDELSLAFTGGDTLILLSQEYPMLGTNSAFEPLNGVIFGDPYMNLVLRSFAINDEGVLYDVDENQYFTDIPELAYATEAITSAGCYPNPCSDNTNLEFGLSRTTTVSIDLYDIKGIILYHLIKEKLPAGTYEMKLNTSILKTGNYICRIQTKEGVRTVKIIVSN